MDLNPQNNRPFSIHIFLPTGIYVLVGPSEDGDLPTIYIGEGTLCACASNATIHKKISRHGPSSSSPKTTASTKLTFNTSNHASSNKHKKPVEQSSTTMSHRNYPPYLKPKPPM